MSYPTGLQYMNDLIYKFTSLLIKIYIYKKDGHTNLKHREVHGE
jgi:hypothetical protein